MVFVERRPWPTVAVALEAIFLSTFVLIGPHRQAAFQQAKADHDFMEAEQELRLDIEITRNLDEVILEMRDKLLTGTTSPDGTRAWHR
jgi:hypothetical protein